jgi:hypothetical protein
VNRTKFSRNVAFSVGTETSGGEAPATAHTATAAASIVAHRAAAHILRISEAVFKDRT